MFRHQGKSRTIHHDLQIASLLSFVAGMVNVAGFLSIQKLTTNVTGHFAFFVDEILLFNFIRGLIIFLYILFFFLGSFVSSFLVELTSRKNEHYMYVVPIIIESMILSTVAIAGQEFITNYPDVIAYSLLFAMGLQNSLVTRISNATVRTTHLTGLFTDMGIELSQLFFYKPAEAKAKLITSIRLRLRIILFFFMGGIIGGLFYSRIGLYVLLIGGVCLLAGLLYDTIKENSLLWKQKK